MSADAVTNLREQIRKRNLLIDEMRREIQEKDALIARLSQSAGSASLSASSPVSGVSAQQLDQAWREGLEHGRAQSQQELDRLRNALAQHDKSSAVTPSSHRMDPSEHVHELEQNLASARARYRSVNDSYMSLRADVKLANNQLHRFYLQRQAGFCFTQSQLSKGLPVPAFQPTPVRGTASKRSRGELRGARGRGRGGLTRSSEGSQNVQSRSRYPPGTYPLAVLTPSGVPLILFVPLEITENGLVKLLKEELESLLLRVRGKQSLLGYPYPPPAFLRPQDSASLIPLVPDQPILHQNFIQPYRTAGAIAVVSYGDSSAIAPSLSTTTTKVSDPSARPTKERKWDKTPSSGARPFQTMRSEGQLQSAGAASRAPKTYTLRERRMRSSTEMVKAPITLPVASSPTSREKNPVKSIWPPVAKAGHSEHAREQLKGKKSSVVNMWITVGGHKHDFHFPSSATEQIMKRIILQRLHPHLTENQIVSEALRYNLKVTGTSYFIAGGESVLRDFPIVTFCGQKRLKPMLTLVNKEESKADKLVSVMIGTILSESAPEGFTFEWLSMEDNDASDFRIRMSQALGERESFYSPYIHAEVAAPPPKSSDSKDSYTTRVYLDDSDLKTTEHMRVTIAAGANSTISALISSACKKFALSMQCNFAPNDYILCVAGQACYIPPETRLGHLVYVQQCSKLQKDIFFVLVPKTRHPSIPELCRLKPGERLNDAIALNSETPFDSATVAVMGSQDTVSLLELKTPVEFRVVDVQNLSSIIKKSDLSLLTFHVSAGIYFGGEKIPPDQPLMTTSSNSALPEGKVRWRQWLRSTMRLCDLPEDSRLCITLWSRNSSSGSTSAIANVNCSLFDFKDRYRTGQVKFRMWLEGEANPIGTCMENLRAAPGTVPLLTLSFHSFPLEVAYPVLQPAVLYDARISVPNAATATLLKRIVASDPLYQMPPDERQIVWKYRDWLRKEAAPRALVKILECVTWYNVHAVRDTYRLLSLWTLITPVDALQLLDAKFANRKVREYAVRCLNKLDDRELKDYLLQLVQALKYEANHFSPLAVWLVKRALQSPMLLGVPFFWMLKSEIHVPEISERYALLLEMYLRRCGSQRDDLYQQARIVTKLNQVALSIKSVPSSRRKQEVQKRLAALDLPPTFQLPLDAKRVASGIVTEKCKSMDSAKAPLWLVFKNADPNGETIWLIFKSGDDLRQDLLTLQMLGIMDRIWKEEKLDLCLTPYKCVATGDEMGMIETVLESDTAANIQKAAGGVAGALKQTPLANWIRKHNPGDAYDHAVWNFTRSCAGYCVATYVLGIGDRHNDNIMVNQQGFLFHIDFGHFLGHYKTIVLNVRRERAPFVLTPEFANVMGSQSSDNFSTFVQLCCEGYNIIRRHANVFINLFAMMLSTGIPELQSEDDIQYLRKALQMDLNEEEAAKHFTKLIKESIESMSTQIMFVTHILAHMK